MYTLLVHVIGKFEISQPYLKLIESQNSDNTKPYSVMGNMVSHLVTPFSVVSCKSGFDFLDIVIFKMLHGSFVRIPFFLL